MQFQDVLIKSDSKIKSSKESTHANYSLSWYLEEFQDSANKLGPLQQKENPSPSPSKVYLVWLMAENNLIVGRF